MGAASDHPGLNLDQVVGAGTSFLCGGTSLRSLRRSLGRKHGLHASMQVSPIRVHCAKRGCKNMSHSEPPRHKCDRAPSGGNSDRNHAKHHEPQLACRDRRFRIILGGPWKPAHLQDHALLPVFVSGWWILVPRCDRCGWFLSALFGRQKRGAQRCHSSGCHN